MGAAAKGGTTALNEVYEYAQPVTAKGFVFMDTPGYDPVSATGQVAGGANVLCFTTGRGSAYGCKPTPSVKLATNNDTYRRMIEDMDINCGDVVDGVSIADKGRRFSTRFCCRLWRTDQVRGLRLRRRGICPLANRSDDVTTALDPPSKGDASETADDMKTALLFDLDGTLVDSDAEHCRFPARVCAARN